MEDAVVSAPQAAPTAKQLLHKPIVKIALGMLAVSATFVFLSAKQTPTVNGREVPVPFLPSGSANLAGSVTYVRTLPNGIEFYNMDFVGDNSQQAAADKVYLVKVPSGVSPVPFERMILDSNGSTRPYYGYIYTSANATTEIANQNAPQFATRFPGTFFASAACKTAHGGDLDSFATLNNIIFKTAGATNADANGVIFQGPQLIAFVPVDQSVTLNISSFCGNGVKTTDEACDDGDNIDGDGCSATCTVEAGFTCDAGSPTICTANPACGDGFVTQGETCDDGNTDAGDGCNASCAVESGYTCDAGQPSLCTKLCGNGTRDQGETCDDGNTDAGDGCSAVCAVESGYTCDTSTPNVCTPDAAAAVCGNSQREGDLCGNQFVDNDEECDWAIDCAGVADGQSCDCHADCTICDGNEDCTFTRPAYNGETCDDGNTAGGDGCNAVCSVEDGYTCDTASPNVCSIIVDCGNGVVEQGEQCDDDDAISGDGCSSTCQVELGFTCDQSQPTICTADPVCGDGFVTQGEACDDGNTGTGDGCSDTCTVEAGYVCDAGQPSLCSQTCGDGNHDQGEACDDGNIFSGDGCSPTCQVEAGFTCDGSEPDVCDLNPNAVCGNGEREGDLCGNQFVDNNEECDWAIDCAGVADGQQCVCHPDCTLCDGNEDCTFTRPAYNGETCDDGNTTAGDGCNATCDVENGYVCDTASPNVCTSTSVCGDGSIGGSEVCDDGNTVNGDGCDSTCNVESGYLCSGEPSVCAVCGNGSIDGNETCDDGNTTAADGCSATCTVENGYSCSGQPSTCTQIVCGNGIRQLGEGCDDGNTTAGDGCNATCQIETGYGCSMATPNVCALNCNDLDSNDISNPNEVITFGTGHVQDRCDSNPLAEELIYEQQCNPTTLMHEEVMYVCPVGTTCGLSGNGAAFCTTTGAPAPSGGELNCTETDGGFDIFTAGTASNPVLGLSDADQCVNGNTGVQETYCQRGQGSVYHISLTCAHGCSNNACNP